MHSLHHCCHTTVYVPFNSGETPNILITMEAYLMENILHLATVFWYMFFSIKAIQYQEVHRNIQPLFLCECNTSYILSISMNKTLHHTRTCTQSEPAGPLILNLKHFYVTSENVSNSTRVVENIEKKYWQGKQMTNEVIQHSKKINVQQTYLEFLFISRHKLASLIPRIFSFLGINSQI